MKTVVKAVPLFWRQTPTPSRTKRVCVCVCERRKILSNKALLGGSDLLKATAVPPSPTVRKTTPAHKSHWPIPEMIAIYPINWVTVLRNVHPVQPTLRSELLSFCYIICRFPVQYDTPSDIPGISVPFSFPQVTPHSFYLIEQCTQISQF